MSSNIYSLNKQALDLIKRKDPKSAYELLKKVQNLLIEEPPKFDSSKLWALTLNSLGCYYRKINKPTLAIHHLKKAIYINRQSVYDPLIYSTSHLSLCSVYSQLGKYRKALTSAQRAIKIIQSVAETNTSLINKLVIAHHNAGMAHQMLDQNAEAAKNFYQGLTIAKENLTPKHRLSIKLQSKYIDAIALSSVEPLVVKQRSTLALHYPTRESGAQSVPPKLADIRNRVFKKHANISPPGICLHLNRSKNDRSRHKIPSIQAKTPKFSRKKKITQQIHTAEKKLKRVLDKIDELRKNQTHLSKQENRTLRFESGLLNPIRETNWEYKTQQQNFNLVNSIMRIRTYTVKQAINNIESFATRSQRMTNLLGYRSNDITINFKQVILLCNSLAIVLLKFGLLSMALKVLKRALRTDIQLFFFFFELDKLWFQRPLVYINLGYLMQCRQDYQGCLKFLFDAQSLLEQMDDSMEARDLNLSHAMISFVVLFKLHKYSEASKYLQVAQREYSLINNNDRQTKFNRLSCANLFCLLTLSREILIETEECGEKKKQNLTEILNVLPADASASMSLLGQYINSRTRKDSFYILLSEEFQNVLYLACMFPYIDRSTPAISINALNKAQDLYQKQNLDNRIPAGDLYAALMEEAMSGVTPNQILSSFIFIQLLGASI